MKQTGKDFVACVALWIVGVAGGVTLVALYRFATMAVAAQAGVGPLTVEVTILVLAVVLAALQTAREARKRRKEAAAVSILLEEAITDYKHKLAAIDAEPAGGGKAKRRAVCKITLVALEEKRDRIIRDYGRRGA